MSTADFVSQLYQNMFGRAPSQAEATFWAARIDSGLESSTQVALDFLNSPEGVNAASVARLYQAALGRTPDLAGFKVQVGALSSVTLNQLAQGFAGSAEFQSSFVGTGGFSVNAFVDKLYSNILGRTPDAPGRTVQVDFYNSLIAGGKTALEAQATLLQAFANSTEFLGNTARNFDKLVVLSAGLDGGIPFSTTAAPSWLLQLTASVPLATVATMLNDGVNGNGIFGNAAYQGMLNNQVLITAAAAGSTVNGTAAADTFNADWAGVNGTKVIGGDGIDILSLWGAPASSTIALDSVEQIVLNAATGLTPAAITLTLDIAHARDAGHIDTITLGGTTNGKPVALVAVGVENILVDANDISPASDLSADTVFNFTGSTSLANLTIHGGRSFAVSGFAGNATPNLVIDASAATGSGSIDASTYAGGTGVTILGGSGGTGFTGALTGSAAGDVIRGGKLADVIKGGGGADVLTGGDGDDRFLVAFDSTTTANDSSVNAADTITDYAKAAAPTSTSGFDRIQITDTAGAATMAIAGNNTGTTAGTNWAIASGVLSFTGGTQVTTLAGAIAVADAAAATAGNAVSFLFNGDTYLFEQGGANDVLIKLAGVSGITSLNLSNGFLFAA